MSARRERCSDANAGRVVGRADEFYAGGFEGGLDFLKRARVTGRYAIMLLKALYCSDANARSSRQHFS